MKKLFIHFLVALLTLQGTVAAVFLSAAHAQAASRDVVINEVMWMGSYSGSTSHSSDEWIELYNTTDQDIALETWQLTNVNLPNFPAGATIPAHGYYLVSNYSENSSSSVLNVTPDWVDSALSISNSCQVIDLVKPSATLLSSIVDMMGCDGSNYLAGVNDTTNHIRRAMERTLAQGDGTVAGSWQNSVGFVNLDDAAWGHTYATPKYLNDATAPVVGTLSASPAYFDQSTGVTASWQGFSDAESGIDHYQVALSTDGTGPNLTGFQTVAGSQSSYWFDLTSLPLSQSLQENHSYYAVIEAVDGAGIVSSLVASAAVIYRHTTPPDAFTLQSASDTPSDNGGSIDVAWQASSGDVTDYQVQYQPTGQGWASPQTFDAGLNLTATVTGLQNAPAAYDFRVKAQSFNGTSTISSNELDNVSALDNLPPTLDASKLSLSANEPGTTDTVQGADGSSTESGTISVYAQDPTSNPSATLIGSMPLDGNLGFLPISIGDNQYAAVWLRAADQAGNTSNVVKLTNDIVAPNAPTLTKLDANCASTCQVQLNWQDNGPDTISYQVGYTPTDGTEQRSLRVTTPSATLTLNPGTGYDFVVYAFDGAENVSPASNSLHAQLTSGVETIVTYQNGSVVTTTTALSGARESAPAAPTTPFGATKVEAAAPSSTPGTPTTSSTSEKAPAVAANKTNQTQSWIKILIIIVLLLIIAGGFYLLSRSYDKDDQTPNTPAKSSAQNRSGRRRGRPRRRS